MIHSVAALWLTVSFLRPTPVLVLLDEDGDDQTIVDACHLPAGEVELDTRSNMLRASTVDALRRCRAPRVMLRSPLLPVHLDRLIAIPRAEPTFDLVAGQELGWQEISRLGPRRIHVRVGGELNPERSASLARLRNAEIELDLRGRVPRAGELAQFASLQHATRTVRLGADSSADLIAGLRQVPLSALVVETAGNHLPHPLLEALASCGVPVRVSLSWPFTRDEVEAIAEIPRLSLEVVVGRSSGLSRRLREALDAVEPATEPHPPPDGGFRDPLESPDR